jgi:hypothetical protein
MTVVLRRYGLVAWWGVFALGTLWAARWPGFVPTPQLFPYPWLAVLRTWGVLAVETAALYGILRPLTLPARPRRIWIALFLETILLAWRGLTLSTDMPDYYYVPVLFSAANEVAFWAAALAMRTQGRQPGHAISQDGASGPTTRCS